ncbi:regulatory signaling modulator protein AmpE [Thalassotalea ponticola]|uniref:regulatory signaling modulator protein AmpE n=1 Tax=Thalassotalea ponticola TaxID=1523392 RepID=UPI0025B55F7E|nr:regulatory signaling modulator protein AmpE [Thalassotalea ponticola]MDN3653586.1 regulatory signaling modulator protein AmpE [Thalassotalea ponticola]
MSLISLLFALAAERVLMSQRWHFDVYYRAYVRFVRRFVSKGEICKSRGNLLAFAVLPALALWAVLEFIDSAVIEFLLSTAILMVCIGCQTARNGYKHFLNAAMRGDDVAMSHQQMQLQGEQSFDGETFGQTLVWLNYRYYMAVMILFVFFGIAAVVFYRLLVAANTSIRHDNDDLVLPEQAQQKSASLLAIIDFIPVRFVAFGYMLVGHFSRALSTWLEGLLNSKLSNRQYLCDVAKQSEEITVADGDYTSEPSFLVRLAKRNVMLLLAAVAFLTLAGAVH